MAATLLANGLEEYDATALRMCETSWPDIDPTLREKIRVLGVLEVRRLTPDLRPAAIDLAIRDLTESGRHREIVVSLCRQIVEGAIDWESIEGSDFAFPDLISAALPSIHLRRELGAVAGVIEAGHIDVNQLEASRPDDLNPSEARLFAEAIESLRLQFGH